VKGLEAYMAVVEDRRCTLVVELLKKMKRKKFEKRFITKRS
jgi:hypothetical protein